MLPGVQMVWLLGRGSEARFVLPASMQANCAPAPSSMTYVHNMLTCWSPMAAFLICLSCKYFVYQAHENEVIFNYIMACSSKGRASNALNMPLVGDAVGLELTATTCIPRFCSQRRNEINVQSSSYFGLQDSATC